MNTPKINTDYQIDYEKVDKTELKDDICGCDDGACCGPTGQIRNGAATLKSKLKKLFYYIIIIAALTLAMVVIFS